MLPPGPHPREAERLAALRALDVLDTPPDPQLDALTRSACRLFKVPTALISLVDADRQWFKSCQGLAASETPREVSFCGHAILGDRPFVVEDALEDPRFADNPLVAGELGLRFYAGAPLRDAQGLPYGTLCLIDYRARSFTPEEGEALSDLAAVATVLLQATRAHASTQLETLLNAMGEGYALQGPQGDIQTCNGAAEQILGLSRDQMLGRTSLDPRWAAIREDGTPLPGSEHPAAVALREGAPQLNQVMGIHKPDGTLTWILVNARLLPPGPGGARKVVSTFLDITRRKEAETRYRAITENVPGMVYQFQTWPDGRVAFPFVSQGVERLYGVSPKVWQTDPGWGLRAILEEDQPSYQAAFEAALAGQETFQWEGRTRTGRPGELLWIRAHSQPAPQPDGSVIWDGLVSDITALKRQEADLAQQTAFLESLFRSAQVAIISTDLQGQITSFNAHAEALLGWSSEEVVGRETPALWHDPGEVVDRAGSLSAELGREVPPGFEVFVAKARMGAVEQRPWTFVARDGSRVPVLLTVSGMRDTRNTLVGFLGVAADLRELRAREEALRISELRFKDLVASVPGVVFQAKPMSNGERTFPFVSEYSQTLLGIRAEDFPAMAHRLLELVHEEDRGSLATCLLQARETRTPVDWVGRFHRADDHQLRWIRIQALPSLEADGSTVWNGLVLDLTERVTMEVALKASEERWSLALQANNDGIWDWNVETGEAWFSPRYMTMLGYEPGELPGFIGTWKDLCHPEDLPEAYAMARSYIEGRSPTYQIIFRMRHKDGTWRWILSRGVGRRGPEGHVIRIVGSHADITQQREAEQALQASQARSQALIEAMPDLILLVHRDGSLLEIHDAHGGKSLPRPREEMLGRNLRDFLPPNQASDRLARIRHVVETGEIQTYESPVPTAAGLVEHDVRLVPCGPDSVLLIARDITERKALDRLKSDFISTVNHELRTPLTSIKGALGLMAGGVTGALPPKALDLSRMALDNADRLSRLIDDLLDLAKAESAQLRLEMTAGDLHHLVLRALESVRPYAQSQDVALVYRPTVVTAPVRVDGDRMIQVILNLLSNAVKYGTPGTEAPMNLEPGPMGWRLSVENRGPMIPEAFRTRIFQKFAMADGSDTRARGGTGLGLAISKALVERMGGTIDYDSTPERTRFTIDLPPLGEAP